MASTSSLRLGVLAPAQLCSRSSEVTGARISSRVQVAASSRAPLVVAPLASRRCDLTGKKANNGYKVSFSNKRSKKLQGVNLQYKRLWWEEGNRFVKLRLSTKALKTVEKKGLGLMAKEAGIDLAEYSV